jgi:hypothetical protein
MKRIDLSRLFPKFTALVMQRRKDLGLTQKGIAAMAGLSPSELCDLLHKRRPLTAHYIFMFVRKGVFKVSDIRDDMTSNGREGDFWAMASEAENVKILSKIARVRTHVPNTDALLESFLDTLLVGYDKPKDG